MGVAAAGLSMWACASKPEGVATDPAVRAYAFPREDFHESIGENADRMMKEGQETFRYDTFGSEAFWGGQLQMHRMLVRAEKGGIGEGVTARQALQLGLKVDVNKVPRLLGEVLKEGSLDLDSADTTLELLRADAVVGVKGFFDDNNNITSVGITCALCHSTVDDSFMKGIGRRLDGWPNRDLDVGKVIAGLPNLTPLSEALGISNDDAKKVLLAWGPGRYDAELDKDGKGFRPDGKTAATLLPAAFGLAGQNLHTYNGWGSVPYWNAYVARTQMHGRGTFVDRRLKDKDKFPLVQRTGEAETRDADDRITDKLAALQFYQLAIPAPKPPKGSFDAAAAKRGESVFNGQGRCSTCHVPPLFSEPGYPMHTGAEIGIDDFQADRSPDGLYRTTPLRGLFTRSKGGFYHDGRFPDLDAVVRHYEPVLGITLSDRDRADLIEYLKSL